MVKGSYSARWGWMSYGPQNHGLSATSPVMHVHIMCQCIVVWFDLSLHCNLPQGSLSHLTIQQYCSTMRQCSLVWLVIVPLTGEWMMLTSPVNYILTWSLTAHHSQDYISSPSSSQAEWSMMVWRCSVWQKMEMRAWSPFLKFKVHTYTHVHVQKWYVHVYSSYMALIGVHEMHGWMHPDQGHVTNLFAVAPLLLFGYLTVSPTHPVTSN